MLAINSTEVRKDFGRYIDIIVREKPVFVKRSRDYFMGINIEMAKMLLEDITFTASKYVEDDNSVTLSLDNFDIVVNEKTQEDAVDALLIDLREYAYEIYEEPKLWLADPNRTKHFKSLLKVLITEDDNELKDIIKCQAGKN